MTEPIPPTRKPALPFVMVPHWLVLTPISPQAIAVYTVLAGHVNQTDPANREAWPTQKRIAAMLGFKDPDSVHQYIRELENVEAITVRRGRHPLQPMRKRNYYTVRLAFDPAPDSAPTLMFADFTHELDGDEFDDVPAGGDGTRLEPGSVVDQPTSGAASVASEGTEPGYNRVREPDQDRASEPGPSRVELEAVDLEAGDKEAVLGPGSVERADPDPDRLPDNPIILPLPPRPNGRATSQRLRSMSPCGNPLCHNGVLHIGVNRRRCLTCLPDAVAS